MGVAFLAALVLTLFVIREPMEPLTSEALHEARDRWRQAGINDYQLRYDMHGSRYEVRVRHGLVVNLQVNGRQPVSADWGAYSVEGLFEVLEMELENLTDTTGPFGASVGPVIARVRFNDQQGHLERYVRSGSGGGRPVSIQLLEFAHASSRD